jgi:ADP-ribose pyrophosphatase YjhB (NUDIX family)
MIERFNVRVYFLLGDEDHRHILISDEIIKGDQYTKFPGGGLEFGEGPEDTALREAQEELGQEIELGELVYATGFFQRSAFNSRDQVLAIYYRAKLIEPARFRIATNPFDFVSGDEGEESFRWVALNNSLPECLSFPSDIAAAEKFLKMLKNGN